MAILRFLDRLWRLVDDALPGLLIGLVTATIAIDIVLRNFFRSTIPHGVEMSTYAFVWMIFLGAAGASRTGTHFQVDFVDNFKNATVRLVARLGIEGICLAIAAIMAWFSWEYTMRSWNRLASGIELPLGYFYMIFPFCFALMALSHLRRAVQLIAGRDGR